MLLWGMHKEKEDIETNAIVIRGKIKFNMVSLLWAWLNR